MTLMITKTFLAGCGFWDSVNKIKEEIDKAILQVQIIGRALNRLVVMVVIELKVVLKKFINSGSKRIMKRVEIIIITTIIANNATIIKDKKGANDTNNPSNE